MVLAPTFTGGFTSGSSTTSRLVVFSWNWLLLSPPVARADDLFVNASIRLPTGWKFGTALTKDRESGGEVTFRTASLTILIDSPVLASEHFRSIPLSTVGFAVEMDIAADRMPAANAKLGPGMTVAAIDGKKFSPDAPRDVVSAAKTSDKPIQLLVKTRTLSSTIRDYPIGYHGGEQYPHLVRDNAKPDVLSQTIAPLTSRR
ncbi:MAG TPA: hypothetical protein VFN75_05510 [Pseudonocardiaceae bacterium]|nr:hypothetical protein [Pseudonocardiaceae bacterium]